MSPLAYPLLKLISQPVNRSCRLSVSWSRGDCATSDHHIATEFRAQNHLTVYPGPPTRAETAVWGRLRHIVEMIAKRSLKKGEEPMHTVDIKSDSPATTPAAPTALPLGQFIIPATTSLQ